MERVRAVRALGHKVTIQASVTCWVGLATAHRKTIWLRSRSPEFKGLLRTLATQSRDFLALPYDRRLELALILRKSYEVPRYLLHPKSFL